MIREEWERSGKRKTERAMKLVCQALCASCSLCLPSKADANTVPKHTHRLANKSCMDQRSQRPKAQTNLVFLSHPSGSGLLVILARPSGSSGLLIFPSLSFIRGLFLFRAECGQDKRAVFLLIKVFG